MKTGYLAYAIYNSDGVFSGKEQLLFLLNELEDTYGLKGVNK